MAIGTVKIKSIHSVTIGGVEVGTVSEALANWTAADTTGKLFAALENYLNAFEWEIMQAKTLIAEQSAEIAALKAQIPAQEEVTGG